MKVKKYIGTTFGKTVSRLATLPLLLAGLLGAGCSGNDNTESSGDKWGRIAVSAAPQEWIASRLSADSLNVTVMIPPGSDPETSEPSISDLRSLSGSRVWFWLDTPGYERRLKESVSTNFPDLQPIDCTSGIDKITGTHGGTNHKEEADPHYFSSARNMEAIAKSMAAGLIKEYPGHKGTIMKNLEGLTKELKEMDDSLGAMTSGGKAFVTEHPSLSYFARDYGLRQISLTADGKETTPEDYARLLRRAKEENGQVVFYEKGHSPKQAFQTASQLGVPAMETDLNSVDWKEGILKIGRELRQTSK